jgi:uncharacterized protein related to proFAR isomerase
LTLEIPVIYVKDKQAFTKTDGIMKLLGNPLIIAKDQAKKGIKLIHIIDEDAKRGLATNLDIYDKLTFFINVQVECGEHEEIIEKLLRLKARVVLHLPTKLDLSIWQEHERLLVGIVNRDYEGSAEGVYDLIVEGADEAKVKQFQDLGKRIMINEEDKKSSMKNLFGILKQTIS